MLTLKHNDDCKGRSQSHTVTLEITDEFGGKECEFQGYGADIKEATQEMFEKFNEFAQKVRGIQVDLHNGNYNFVEVDWKGDPI